MSTVTIGTFTAEYLTAQPFGYAGSAEQGLTAKEWSFSCVVTPAQETALLAEYDAWQGLKIAEEDPLVTGVVGATVSLTAATDSVSVSGLACWFNGAPEIQQSGVLKVVSFGLVDAAQALAVLQAENRKSDKVPGTVTIGAFSSSYLTAYPSSYEGEARTGLTARTWTFTAVLTPAEEASLFSVYDTWRDARIQDEDTLKSGVVGTTVSLTVSGLDVGNVAGLAVWFSRPPSSSKVGRYKQVSWEVVDAAQALEVLQRQEELRRERNEAIEGDFGTIVLGAATLTLLQPIETFTDGPQVELLSTGQHYVTGSGNFARVRDVQGRTDATGWSAVLSWYESTVQATIAPGVWFPVTAPTASGDAIIDGGVKSTRYTVSVRLVEVI